MERRRNKSKNFTESICLSASENEIISNIIGERSEVILKLGIIL
jgi:hypothetical protein